METVPNAMGTPTRLELPERLDAVSLAELRTAALAARGADLDLDGSAVRRAGGLGLQFLLAARSAWDADGHALRLVEPSEPLREALTTLGAPHLIEAEAASLEPAYFEESSFEPALLQPTETEQPGDLA